MSGVNTHFFVSLLRRKISENVKPADSYPDTPTLSTPPTTSTSSSSTSAAVPASVSHTPPSSIGPSAPPTGLSSPPSPAIFFSRASKGEGETAARITDSVSAWDELMSSSRMTLFSDTFRNQIRS